MPKLYEVPKNSRVRITKEDGSTFTFNFHHIDGMYSYCTDLSGLVMHVAAWTEVEVVND